MRRALVGLAAMLAMACHDGSSPTAPAVNGTLNIQLDPLSCAAQGSFDVDVYIDHVLVGTPTLTDSSTSSFTVLAGDHTLGGIAKNGKFDWVSNDIVVPAGGEYTAQFGC